MKDIKVKNDEALKTQNELSEGMDRRAFLQKTTMVFGAAMGASFVGSLTSLPVSAASNSSIIESKKVKPKIVFPVISDVHMNKNSNQTLEKFKTTLDQLNLLVPKQDAFVVVGDLTDNGYTEEYDKFFSTYNAKKQKHAISLIAIGNHDYWNGLSVSEAQKRFLERSGMESIYFHKVIKGYHFIILGTEDGLTEGTFSVTQINWLEQQLKQAAQEDPNKPIFVFHHQPIMGTVYGSEWGFAGNRDLFYNTLAAYPQVISFSGHTHYPLDDPKIIHQKDFTSIGTSTGAYLWLDAGRVQGEVPEGADILNQALIVEVYNNKVLLKRRDIHNNNWTAEPFEITLPANKNDFIYTEVRDQKAPFFTKDSLISIKHDLTTPTSLAVMFTQAKDDLLVHDYKVEITDSTQGKKVKEFLAFSEFYKDPIPNPLTLRIDGLQPNTLYEINVFALDAFGNQSPNALKVLGKTIDGEIKDITITLSKNTLTGSTETVDVLVENARVPQGDWIGLYEVSETPGNEPAIWWEYTNVTNGTYRVTYDPSKNSYPGRYQSGKTYKFVYFYGSGYDAVTHATFTVN
jgi:3',5'-cyclic AMP phosphodiesterase CpdA